MTAEFRFMLSLYAQGVHGVEAVTLPKISLPRLLEISNQQQLLPIVIDTLTDSYDLQKLQIESEYWDSIKKVYVITRFFMFKGCILFIESYKSWRTKALYVAC